MAQNKRDIADILHDYISEASERIEESLEITEPHPITMPIQENVTICGMIIMEGAKGSDGVFLARGDEEVKLDLENVESYSIYPGMICAIEGNNPTGQTFVVKNITHQKFLPIQEESRVVDNTNILIACGPFFTIDSVSEEPLDELVREATEIAPHLVVLIGPFLEEKHMGTDFIQPKELSELIASKVAEMKKVGSQVLLVPSAKDFFADPIMPTPEIDEPGKF